jgi:hypothetical protein
MHLGLCRYILYFHHLKSLNSALAGVDPYYRKSLTKALLRLTREFICCVCIRHLKSLNSALIVLDRALLHVEP